jgi:hypothetical protein
MYKHFQVAFLLKVFAISAMTARWLASGILFLTCTYEYKSFSTRATPLFCKCRTSGNPDNDMTRSCCNNGMPGSGVTYGLYYSSLHHRVCHILLTCSSVGLLTYILVWLPGRTAVQRSIYVGSLLRLIWWWLQLRNGVTSRQKVVVGFIQSFFRHIISPDHVLCTISTASSVTGNGWPWRLPQGPQLNLCSK